MEMQGSGGGGMAPKQSPTSHGHVGPRVVGTGSCDSHLTGTVICWQHMCFKEV